MKVIPKPGLLPFASKGAQSTQGWYSISEEIKQTQEIYVTEDNM